MWIYIALALSAALAAGLIGWGVLQTRAHRRRLEQLRREHREETQKLRREFRRRLERLERDLEQARKRGHLDFARDLIEAVDALDRAREQLPPDLSDEVSDTLDEGLAMVGRQLREAFRRHGMEPMAPEAGEAFDPERHEAWGAEKRTDVERKEVLRTHRRGWRFGEMVLRAAAVDVAILDRPKESEDGREPAPEASDTAEEVRLNFNKEEEEGEGLDAAEYRSDERDERDEHDEGDEKIERDEEFDEAAVEEAERSEERS